MGSPLCSGLLQPPTSLLSPPFPSWFPLFSSSLPPRPSLFPNSTIINSLSAINFQSRTVPEQIPGFPEDLRCSRGTAKNKSIDYRDSWRSLSRGQKLDDDATEADDEPHVTLTRMCGESEIGFACGHGMRAGM